MKKPPRRLLQTLRIITGRKPIPEGLAPSHRALYEQLRDLVTSSAIVGAAVSGKETAGSPTEEDGIVFYVREKVPLKDLRPSLSIPPVIPDPQGRAIFTDVRAVGDVRLQANVAHAPVRSGFSVSHAAGAPGTVAAIVTKGGARHILSAKHVLTNFGRGRAGDGVYFPARGDGGRDPADRVATLVAFTAFDRGNTYPNGTDAALALLAEGATDDRAIPGARLPLAFADPVQGMRVRLSGRTSETSPRATVTNAAADIELDYDGLGKIGFYEQVECPCYTEGGDSGALVLDADSGAVVGLHIGGSTLVSYFTPIKRVIRKLEFSF